MNLAFVAAGLLAAASGIAHSFLGERLIVRPILGLPDLPKLAGSRRAMGRVVRFAWHLTSIAWWGIAAVFFLLAAGSLDADGRLAARVLAVTFLASGLLALVASKGRHPFWVAALGAAGAAWWGTGP